MLFSLTPRRASRVLRTAAAAAAIGALFLATAVAHVVVVPPAAHAHPAGFGVLQAEIHACMATSGRGHDDCLDEIEGKALIQRAEWLAENDRLPAATADDGELGDGAARPPRSSTP
jgi:hypothetical protein